MAPALATAPVTAPASKPEAVGEWAHMAAGGLAGTTAVLFLHPFDVVKTRLQVQDGLSRSLSMYKGPIDAVRTITAQEGWRAFYKGLSPAIVGSGVAWAAYFYVYEAVKNWHMRWQGSERLSAGWNMLSAAQAGATVCMITNPIWLIKTRLQLQRGTPSSSPLGQALGAAGAAASAGRSSMQYTGFADALSKIFRAEGIRGLYKGLGPSLLLQSTHGAIQFSVYEELKYISARFRAPNEDGSERAASSVETSLFAACSKLSASIITYPTQVIRARLQQCMQDRTLVYKGMRQAVQLTWAREGLRGFYKGLGPALIRTMPQSAVTLVVYENTLRLIAEAAAKDVATAAAEAHAADSALGGAATGAAGKGPKARM